MEIPTRIQQRIPSKIRRPISNCFGSLAQRTRLIEGELDFLSRKETVKVDGERNDSRVRRLYLLTYSSSLIFECDSTAREQVERKSEIKQKLEERSFLYE